MKKFATAVLPILLTGCVATSQGVKRDQEELKSTFKKNNINNVYAQLIREGNNYKFTNFTLSDQYKSTRNQAWVNLGNKEPLWNYSAVEMCVVTNTGEDSERRPCLTASEARFMERTYDAENVFATVAMVGINMLKGHKVIVSFQADDYFEAYSSAESIAFSSNHEQSKQLALVTETVKKISSEYQALKHDYVVLNQKSPSGFEIGEVLPSAISFSEKFNSFDGLLDYLAGYQDALDTAKLDIETEKTEMDNFIKQKELLAAKQKAEYRNKRTVGTRQEQQAALAKIKNTYDAKAYLVKYRWNVYKDSVLYSQGQELYDNFLKKEFTNDYENLSDLSSYNSFISRYAPLTGTIVDEQLIIKAKQKQKALIQAEQKRKMEQFISVVTNFRAELSEGQDSHCGLIVEVKDKIVNVQTMAGLMFIKRDQLYPVGSAPCKFYNNVYQPPADLPI